MDSASRAHARCAARRRLRIPGEIRRRRQRRRSAALRSGDPAWRPAWPPVWVSQRQQIDRGAEQQPPVDHRCLRQLQQRIEHRQRNEMYRRPRANRIRRDPPAPPARPVGRSSAATARLPARFAVDGLDADAQLEVSFRSMIDPPPCPAPMLPVASPAAKLSRQPDRSARCLT